MNEDQYYKNLEKEYYDSQERQVPEPDADAKNDEAWVLEREEGLE